MDIVPLIPAIAVGNYMTGFVSAEARFSSVLRALVIYVCPLSAQARFSSVLRGLLKQQQEMPVLAN